MGNVQHSGSLVYDADGIVARYCVSFRDATISGIHNGKVPSIFGVLVPSTCVLNLNYRLPLNLHLTNV